MGMTSQVRIVVDRLVVDDRVGRLPQPGVAKSIGEALIDTLDRVQPHPPIREIPPIGAFEVAFEQELRRRGNS
jgi:hypothetical protein